MKLLCLGALCLALLSGGGGCTPYVNIPPNEGDFASHDPNRETVQDVIVAASRAALAESPVDQPFHVILPPGTLPLTYDQTLPKISPHAVWASEGAPEGAPFMEIRQVRIRGSNAEVDIIRPFSVADPEGFQHVVTVTLKWDAVAKWQAERLRAWRTSVDRAMRHRSYDTTEEPVR
jgi:hypothetical protein